MSQNAPRPREARLRGASPNCPLHLRRICGTCAHFEGALRQNAHAPCGKHGGTCHPLSSAADCDDWARPWGQS